MLSFRALKGSLWDLSRNLTRMCDRRIHDRSFGFPYRVNAQDDSEIIPNLGDSW